MKIAVIAAEDRDKEHVLYTCASHADFDGRIACFAEREPRNREYKGVPVHPLSELSNENCDMVLVAIRWNHMLSQTLAFLREKAISEVHILRLYALDTQADFISNGKLDPQHVDKLPDPTEKPYLVHLEAHVCDHCNLNCKACNNFSPFVPEPAHADPAQYEQDLRKLSGLFSNIGRFFLLGGEPLLAPALTCQMIGITRNYFPNSELRLLTNGLLIPQMDQSFWAVLRENKAIVHISAYPPTQKMLQQIGEILDREQVLWIVAKEVKTFVKRWTDAPLEDARKNNERCGSAGCHYLRNGVLSKCPDAALIKNFDSKFGTRLESRDSLHLDEIEDGYRAMESLDRPIDLCAYCTHDRMESVEWEPVGAGPEKAHWLVENRLEYERKEWAKQRQNAADQEEKLTVRCRDAERKNDEFAAQVEALGAELRDSTERRQDAERKNNEFAAQVEALGAELRDSAERCQDAERKNSELAAQTEALRAELRNSTARLEKARRSENDWRRQCDAARRELQGVKARLAETEGHYRAIQNSVSFKFGRAVTWLPRKTRGFVRCLKENGLKYTMKRVLVKTANRVLPDTVLEIYRRFDRTVMQGFYVYKKLYEEYGCQIYLQYYKGTGDVYIDAGMLKNWLRAQGYSEEYVFAVDGKTAAKVAELFDLNAVTILNRQELDNLVLLVLFLNPGVAKLDILHYRKMLFHVPFTIILPGINGVNFFDLYQSFVFSEMPKESFQLPNFMADKQWTNQMFVQHALTPGRTVVLSPYANTIKLSSLAFWEQLAERLQNHGFDVCTNSSGAHEPPIKGTAAVFIPYEKLKCFLEQAGFFIAERSGLCEIVSSVKCKQLIIYPDMFWPPWGLRVGKAIDIFSIKCLPFHHNDIVELECGINDDKSSLIDVIIESLL